MSGDLAYRLAAAILVLSGVGFGLPAILGIRSLAAGEGIPLVFGFPSYGGGPFERIGIQSTVPLLAGFLLVCILEVVAAVALWSGRSWGMALACGLLAPGAWYWWGFALPFGPVFGVVRTALIAWAWKGQ